MNRAGIPVNHAVIFPIPVLADPAKTPLSLWNTASFRTEFALDVAPAEWDEVGREFGFDQPLLLSLSL